MIIFNVQVFEFSISSSPAKHLFRYFKFHRLFRDSFDSSVGRAEDCSGQNVILRSLVRIRLEGNFFFPMIFFFVQKIALNFSLLTYTLHFSTFYCFFGALFIEPNTFIKIIIHGIVTILGMYGWSADFKLELEGASNQSKDIMKAKAFPNLKSLEIKIDRFH